ncbi:MAG: hypothetical protein JXB30_09040 [Anaerolineae bacterium]|nr:hypothetical protein [Anaerolineae bacterium]
MTAHLVIDYVLDGSRPGYTLHHADDLDQAAVKAVWRAAMPRGHGWSDPRLIGATSIKSFALPGDHAAISHVLVTDQVDEHGRAGIRRAEIDVIPGAAAQDVLKHLMGCYPASVRTAANHKLNFGRWLTILNRALPRLLERNDQIVLTHPYTTAVEWQVIEYIVLYLATTWSVRALRGWPRVISLTTLALDVHEEARIVAMPLEAARRLGLHSAVQLP